MIIIKIVILYFIQIRLPSVGTQLVSVIPLTHQTSLSVAIGCNRLQPIGMIGVSPNFGANGSITSNTSVLLASRREIPYRL